MKHEILIEDGFSLKVVGDFNTRNEIDDFAVFKVGEYDPKKDRKPEIEITDFLSTNEYWSFMKMLQDDYLACTEKEDEPDGLALAKADREWSAS